MTLRTIGTLTRVLAEVSGSWPLRRGSHILRRTRVKKLFVVLLAAGAGFALWRKAESGKSHEKLWAEATDKVG